MAEKATPLEKNWRARRVLAALRQGERSTLHLLRIGGIVHPARQIWELRHWYGFTIRTRRMKNRVALYELVA